MTGLATTAGLLAAVGAVFVALTWAPCTVAFALTVVAWTGGVVVVESVGCTGFFAGTTGTTGAGDGVGAGVATVAVGRDDELVDPASLVGRGGAAGPLGGTADWVGSGADLGGGAGAGEDTRGAGRGDVIEGLSF
jgi:hypothetical protein